jgi:hypothetical protein
LDLVGYRVRRGWRDLIRPWLGAITVLAIAGGAAATAAVAARRTDSAYSSLLASRTAADAVLNFVSGNGDALLGRIEALPDVVAHGRGGGSDMYRVAGGAIDPRGVIGGTFAWHAFADQLGVPPDTVVPLAILGVLVAMTVGLSLLLASGAGVQVRRTARPYRFGA